MSEKKSVIYCPECGGENDADTELCQKCGAAVRQKEHLFRDFLIGHIKDELKDNLSGKIFDVLKNWLLSHLYASVVTVMVAAVVSTGAIAVTNQVRTDAAEERPAAVAGVSLLTVGEQALFEENDHHQIFYPEDYENVWRPAVLEHTLLAEKDSCYGWVIVRDMELRAEDCFDGYSELYVCSGITLTVNGDLTQKKGFTDFYVAPGGTLIVNGSVLGGANICNDGTTVINGNYDGGSAQLAFNRGSITVTGAFAGALELYSFRGATVTGTDQTKQGIHYYDIDASELYEGVTGMNGMFVVDRDALK